MGLDLLKDDPRTPPQMLALSESALGRLLTELLEEPEAIGLLALMLIHESRRAARTSAEEPVMSTPWRERRPPPRWDFSNFP